MQKKGHIYALLAGMQVYAVTVEKRVHVSQNLNDAAMCPRYVLVTMKDAVHRPQSTVAMYSQL